MSFFAFYPSSSAAANPSVGGNGAVAPTSSTEVGGINPSGNLQPISVDGAGNQNVNVVSSTLPTGAATAANQSLEIAQLTTANTTLSSINTNDSAINTAVTALNARTAGALVPAAFNEIDLTYITSGNGTGQIGTAIYKNAGTTIATLTLTYDASNNLSTVVKS